MHHNSSIWNRAVAVGLLLCLLTISTPAAPQTLLALAKESSTSFGFWYRASGWAKLIQGRGNARPRKRESQADRDLKVTALRISPGDLTIQLEQRVNFAAIAYDQSGSPVSGVKIKWSVMNERRERRARISTIGEFKAETPGTFKIVAEGAGQRAQATVVVPNNGRGRRNPNEAPTSPRPVSNRERPKGASNQAPRPSLVLDIAKQEKPTSGKGNSVKSKVKSSGKAAAYAHRPGLPAKVSPAPLLDDQGWTDDNYWSSTDPGNGVGTPAGTPLDGGAGSGNFQFAAPVLGLPGRGINLSLGLAYNSRLWNKAGSQITFDIDRSWPAPGFSLGFGKLVGLGIYHGAMIVDADGTRHSFAGTVSACGPYSCFSGHTTDGSLIDYSYQTGVGGVITTAQAKLPNGTVITYGVPGPAGAYPTQIRDANGNILTITYVGNVGPRIDTIVDTLNRSITFHYNSNNLLTAIKAPGLVSGTRELVRLHYHQLSLDYTNAFNGLTPVVGESSPWVIDAIYYPGTATGYWFGDTDSYSSYGMLAKVIEQRGMSFSASSETDMGSVTQGSTTRTETYNYDLSANSSLNDAPTYTEMVESWTRDGTNTDSATTTYAIAQDSTTRTVTITLPNLTKSKQFSYNHPGQYDDGLIYLDETRDSSDTLLQSSSSTWAAGAYDSPRPTRVEKTDERGQVTAAVFDYGSNYNQVVKVWDYGYGGSTLLRTTRTEYENNSNYTNQHIFNLPLNVEIYDSDDYTRLSRTDYAYDGDPTLADTPNVPQHDETYNPYATQYEQCDCIEWDNEHTNCLQWNCYNVSAYNPATAYRGNLTQVTTYATAANLTGAVTETRSYDMTGNVIKASTACCEQTTFEYTIGTKFAYPESTTRGSATNASAQVTTSAEYDLNTGLVDSVKDANGRVSITDYESDTLRPSHLISPTGAHTDYAYDDAAMKVTSTTYLTSGTGGTIADQSEKYLNGHGQVRLEKGLAPGGVWDAIQTIYNNLGQVYQQSRPYRVGTEEPVYGTATYDALGRTRTVTAPDGSVTETFYNETTRPSVASSAAGETTRVKDAWGRERWGRTDSRGRLVEVVEPDPGGNGSVASNGLVTTYAYNTLGNLETVTQDAQTRSFAYDSLGRLTAQKLAETAATLDSSGTYGSGSWSDVFTYDSRSNLTSRTDARGVKTIYDYNNDPLNRLQSVSWDTSLADTTTSPIPSAAAVSYTYRTSSGPPDHTDITQVSSVTAAGVSTESYDFDGEGRVYQKTLTLSSRSSYPFVTTYSFDALDRVTDVQYPAEYGNGNSRKTVHHNFDIASRLTSLTYDSQSFASNITYNAASQTTSLNVGVSGSNQIVENYGYDPQTGLLASQSVARTSSSTTYLLNLEYQYTNSSGKRTGQLVKLLNNLDHNKDRGYTYDALGRLVQATGGPASSVLSTQTYSYDKYGNRLSVSASGSSAKNRNTGGAGAPPALSAQRDQSSTPSVSEPETIATGSINKPLDPKVDLPTDLIARISGPDVKADTSDKAPLDDASRSLLKPSGKGNAEAPPPSSPPTFTDPDLHAPGVYISAVHITELRIAINSLRARLGLSQFTWTKPLATQGVVASGGPITADPIIEMRTALDQALGPPPSPGYAPDLAQHQPIMAVHIQELRDRVVSGWYYSTQIPRDGHASLTYDVASNRITTDGFAYDKAGNQIRALIPGGSGSQKYKYDAANRLVQVLADNGSTVLASYTYGSSNERLIAEEAGFRTYYACGGSVEYFESTSSTVPAWSKSYVYLGGRLLAALTPFGSNGEAIEYHHPDRLGTRLVTNPSNGNSFEQVGLPFGTPLYAESTVSTNKRFTSYDRSATTGLDYANNRHYDSQQGRFTQVDPAGMNAASLASPQTLNLYAYCANDPINHVDPSGLGFLSVLKSLLKRVVRALVHAAVQAAVTLLMTGSIHAAIGVFIGDFLRELALPSRSWLTLSPQWNPNAIPILGGGSSSLSRYIITNFQGKDGQLPDCSTGAVPCEAGGLIVTGKPPLHSRLWGGVKSAISTVAGSIVVAMALGAASLERWNNYMERKMREGQEKGGIYLGYTDIYGRPMRFDFAIGGGLKYSTLPGSVYSGPALSKMAADPLMHGFPNLVEDQVLKYGQRTVLSPNYVQYTLDGTVSGASGRVYQGTFEIGINPATNEITHRFFRPR